MADTLTVAESFRVVLERNGEKLYTHLFTNTADETYTRHATDRLVLSAGMSAYQQASLGDIGASNPGEHLMVISDRPIKIAVNSTSNEVTASLLAMSDTSVTALYFKNEDADNTATVEFLVTD